MKAYIRLMPTLCLAALMATLTGCALASSQGTAIRLTAKNQMLHTVWAQKDHYLQYQTFAKFVSELEGCVNQIGANYRATEIEVEGNRTDSYAITTQTNLYETELFGKPWIWPWQRSGNLYSYVGTAYVVEDQLSIFRTTTKETKFDAQIISIVCQANDPGEKRLERPILTGDRLSCAEGSHNVHSPTN